MPGHWVSALCVVVNSTDQHWLSATNRTQPVLKVLEGANWSHDELHGLCWELLHAGSEIDLDGGAISTVV